MSVGYYGIGIIKICPHTNNKTAHYGEIIIDRDKFRILYFLIVQNKTDFSLQTYQLIFNQHNTPHYFFFTLLSDTCYF